MTLVYLFSFLMILGMFFSQIFDLAAFQGTLRIVTDICLSYILMEVGLEFVLNKKRWREYCKDYLVAALAATVPWFLCFFYFYLFFSDNRWEELLLIARFAAPTSSGILFSMLAAVGLATTWVFRKVEVLAILDDMDTILLLIPLQFLLAGAELRLFVVVFFIIILICLAWRYLHQLRLPTGRIWLLGYSILLAFSLQLIHHAIAVELEILLPAFVFGCLLYNPHDPKKVKEHVHEHAFIEPEQRPALILDRGIKILFMFFVGLSLPKIAFHEMNYWMMALHVLAITLLSNLGKCCPIFFYKDEASYKERWAVSVGMFPRGEVGAGVLTLAISHGAGGYATTVAILSLAVNLLLIGFFIKIVKKLLDPHVKRPA